MLLHRRKKHSYIVRQIIVFAYMYLFCLHISVLSTCICFVYMYLFICLHVSVLSTCICFCMYLFCLIAEKISNISDVMRISRKMSNNLKTSVKVKPLFTLACEQALPARKWRPATIVGVIRSLAASSGHKFLLVENGDCQINKMQNKLKSMQKSEEQHI